MKKSSFMYFCITLVLLVFSSAHADGISGKFTGYLENQRYDLMLRENNNSYQGTIRVGAEQMSLSAILYGGLMAGEISQTGETYEFFAIVQDDGWLYLEGENGEVIMFKPNQKKSTDNAEQSGSENQIAEREVFINQVQVDANTLHAIELQTRLPIADGRYWYDGNSGAWGVEGGPTAGFIYPGLSLPGPMPVNISGGDTGIYINGREIHPLDQQALQQLFGVAHQGEFWMDSQGNLGYIGGPAIANILQAAQAAQGNISSSSSDSVSHGYDSTYGARGTAAGGMYSGRTATGKSVFWYPGM